MRDEAQAVSAFTPSPGTPGEGRGEGSPASEIHAQTEKNPHPNPLPEYRARGQEELRAVLDSAPHVALFVTCLTDQFQPQVGVAVTKVLEHFGCRVTFPRAQTCCGQPFYNNGFHDDAKQLARRMVELFEPYEYVVTPSGSCCAMVREHVPRLLR